VTGRLLVVGGDAAGMTAATTARRRDPSLEILAFERGPYTSYSACGIPYFVAGTVESAHRLLVRSPEDFAEMGIDVRVRHEVVAVDLARRRVTVRDLDAGSERDEGFDQLVIATGAEPISPPIPGADLIEGVRTVDAAERFRAELEEERPGAPRIVIIGAGYIGLEMAEALVERGLSATVVDRVSQVMRTFDPDMAAHIQSAVEDLGIEVLLETDVEAIEHGEDGRPRRVLTSSGPLPADHVIMAVGARAVTRFAADAGLRTGTLGALVVDDHMRCPGAEGVFAAGDCVESRHRISGEMLNVQLGTHANKQGRVVGINATGGDATFPGVIGTAVSRICKWEVGRTGLSEEEARRAGVHAVAATVRDRTQAGYLPGTGPIWVKLVCEAATGRLLGGQIVGTVGAAKRIDAVAIGVWTGLSVGELEWMDLSYAPPFSGVYDPLLVAARQAAKAAGVSVG
jgi:NADPH-dependent 2,4-dienoyl-CoA reductase/sulfur reductase-like enzyme